MSLLSLTQNLLGLIRFSHTIFALPFALLAAALAWSQGTPFRWLDLLGIFLCMIFARSASMAFNRYADRKIDAENPRTANRHIPAGLLSPKAVLIFIVVNSVGFIASTLLFLPNQWPLILSIPVLAFLCGYSLVKRFSMLCHYWLAAALMLSPIAVWIALTGTLSWTPILLAAVIFFWVGGFDIIYACMDYDYDRSKGLYSIPAKLGVNNALRVAFLSHVLMLVSLFGLWYVGQLGTIFLVGIIAVAILLMYEHYLVRPKDLSRVNIAFFNVNAIVSIGLLVVGVADLYLATK